MGSQLSKDQKESLRQLPSISQLLQADGIDRLQARFGTLKTTEQLRLTLESIREQIFSTSNSISATNGNGTSTLHLSAEEIVAQAEMALEKSFASTLHGVINATGVIIHTNLGRAPLSSAAEEAIRSVSGRYSTLEFDITSGKRGKRDSHIDTLICDVTGAADALVVNNTASAVMMILAAFCQGKEVIISRGQLVEIGGGFRVPDVMAQSGAHLVEVGTTNRTHLRDYENAITENTAAIFIAHHSNFRIVGFTSEPPLSEICDLAHAHNIPVIYDQGSGCMLPTAPFGLIPEPTVPEGIAAGCDLVAFSGDKLLGGPQSGMICGAAAWVGKLKKHPLARALRPDKLCIAALAATLLHYLKDEVEQEIPVWRMISMPLERIETRANRWADTLQAASIPAVVEVGYSTVGGGSLPGTSMESRVLALSPPHVERFSSAIRQAAPHVIGRIHENRLLLDPRTVRPDQDQPLLEALIAAWQTI